MLLEFIATVFAGFGAAGLALFGRLVTGKRLPRWTIPAFAGLGMLGFQIVSEYTWFSHQTGLLPKGVVVAKKVTESQVWKPWTYIYPQTLRFIAIDTHSITPNKIAPDVVLADLYFFQRRHSAQRVPQVFHCSQFARADLTENLQIPENGEKLNSQWLPLTPDDPLLAVACRGAAPALSSSTR